MYSNGPYAWDTLPPPVRDGCCCSSHACCFHIDDYLPYLYTRSSPLIMINNDYDIPLFRERAHQKNPALYLMMIMFIHVRFFNVDEDSMKREIRNVLRCEITSSWAITITWSLSRFIRLFSRSKAKVERIRSVFWCSDWCQQSQCHQNHKIYIKNEYYDHTATV